MTVRKETSSPFEVNFPAVKVIDNTNRHNAIYSEIRHELSDFKNNNIQKTIQRTNESDTARETTDKRPNRQQRELTGSGRVSKKPRFLSR